MGHNRAMRGVFWNLVVVGLSLSGFIPTRADMTYNNATDFSLASNPNGVWSYGILSPGSSPNSSTFSLFPASGVVGGSIAYWNESGGGLIAPEAFYNSSSSVENYLTITMQPHQAAFHPGPNGEYGVYRFTAPITGSYTLSATFTGIDIAGTTTDVHVLDNGVSLFQGNINGYLATQSYSSPLSLAAGEIIDFAVGYGTNHNYSNDSTALDATLTLRTASVPEPNSGLLVVMGAAGLVGLRRVGWWPFASGRGRRFAGGS
jgi:hypothetical protein